MKKDIIALASEVLRIALTCPETVADIKVSIGCGLIQVYAPDFIRTAYIDGIDGHHNATVLLAELRAWLADEKGYECADSAMREVVAS